MKPISEVAFDKIYDGMKIRNKDTAETASIALTGKQHKSGASPGRALVVIKFSDDSSVRSLYHDQMSNWHYAE